eukprot:scaffold175661_cov15-Tisochrysis_lutea.AAC.1
MDSTGKWNSRQDKEDCQTALGQKDSTFGIATLYYLNHGHPALPKPCSGWPCSGKEAIPRPSCVALATA